MNNPRLASAMLGSLCALLLAACNDDASPGVANAVAADARPAKRTSHEVCEDKVVTRAKPVKDKDRVLGTVAGAVVGGVVGKEIGGKGTSKDVATVGGAVAGGYAGNRVQKSVQANATEKTTERVCHTVYD